MNFAEEFARQLVDDYWYTHKQRIQQWIMEDIDKHGIESVADFSEFASEFMVNPDVCDMTLEAFIEDMVDFLDRRFSITPKIWNHLQQRYDSLVDSITSELEDTNDSDEHIKEEYYRSVL